MITDIRTGATAILPHPGNVYQEGDRLAGVFITAGLQDRPGGR